MFWPRKFAGFALFLFSIPVLAQLPEAPTPHLDRIQWTLLAGDGALRVLDYYSTTRDLSCACNHEAILPHEVAYNKPALAMFEAGAWASQYLVDRKPMRHHRRIARAVTTVDVVALGVMVGHNFTLPTGFTRTRLVLNPPNGASRSLPGDGLLITHLRSSRRY